MKVYRGPSSKPFNDDSHELVAELDVGSVTTLWHESVLLKVNITKEPSERQSVAHIALSVTDVMALHQRLMAGLLAQSANLRKLEDRVEGVRQHLYEMFNRNSEGETADDIGLLLDLCGPEPKRR